MFRSFAHQLYGDEELHMRVRRACIENMRVNRAYFSQFVVGGDVAFDAYVAEKERDGVWGDDPEIQVWGVCVRARVCVCVCARACVWCVSGPHRAHTPLSDTRARRPCASCTTGRRRSTCTTPWRARG